MPDSVSPIFSDKVLEEVQAIVARYPSDRKKSALLPVLHLAQREFGGWLSQETMDYVASVLDLSPIEVYEVATFYSMFRLQPTGKFVLEVCRTGPCCLVGAEEVVAHLEKKLGIRVGESTVDGMFTLKEVECLASCGTAPVMQLGERYHEHLTPEKVDKILEDLSRGL